MGHECLVLGQSVTQRGQRDTPKEKDLEESILLNVDEQEGGWNDDFGSWDGKLATPRESRILVLTSCTGFISVFIAVLMFHEYWLGGLALIVSVNSINFWRDPVLGCRRNIDFACANLGAGLMGWASFCCEYQWEWIGLMVGIALPLFVAAGKMWINRDKRWVWCHLGFHVLCGFTNYMMYYGRRLWAAQHPGDVVHPPIGFAGW